MINGKQFFVLLILILLTLLLRDLPYLNVVFISRIWLIYFAILFFVILASIKFRVILLWYATFALFLVAFVLTLMRLPFFSESAGILIYFSLWAIVIHVLVAFIKRKK